LGRRFRTRLEPMTTAFLAYDVGWNRRIVIVRGVVFW
jgi:hypothetical protein